MFQARRRIYPLDVLIRALRDFSKDNGSTFAAAMSYYVLLSLFPTLIFAVTIVGIFARDAAFQQQIVDAITNQFPSGLGIRDQIQNVVEGVAQVNSIIGLLGLIGTLWTASNMFAALRRSLNLAFDVPNTRSFFIGRIMDMLSIFGMMFMILLSIGTTAAVRLTEDWIRNFLGDNQVLVMMWNIVYFLLPFSISLVVFIMVYRVIPNLKVKFRYILVSAAISAIGFELAKWGFTYYLSSFATYQEVYGALGGIIAFMVFVFIVSNIVIFSAEIASELHKDEERRTGNFRTVY